MLSNQTSRYICKCIRIFIKEAHTASEPDHYYSCPSQYINASKDAVGMTNSADQDQPAPESVDPDQTVSLGSMIWVCIVCSDTSVQYFEFSGVSPHSKECYHGKPDHYSSYSPQYINASKRESGNGK